MEEVEFSSSNEFISKMVTFNNLKDSSLTLNKNLITKIKNLFTDAFSLL